MDCCACPPVAHCLGREFVSCGVDAAGGSLSHLHAPQCSRCEDGFVPSEDQTACVPAATTSTQFSDPGACGVELDQRADCGFHGIREAECSAKGCCWGGGPSPNPDNVPWCFYPGGWHP